MLLVELELYNQIQIESKCKKFVVISSDICVAKEDKKTPVGKPVLFVFVLIGRENWFGCRNQEP